MLFLYIVLYFLLLCKTLTWRHGGGSKQEQPKRNNEFICEDCRAVIHLLDDGPKVHHVQEKLV